MDTEHAEVRVLFQSNTMNEVENVLENGLDCEEDEYQQCVDISTNKDNLNTPILSRKSRTELESPWTAVVVSIRQWDRCGTGASTKSKTVAISVEGDSTRSIRKRNGSILPLNEFFSNILL